MATSTKTSRPALIAKSLNLGEYKYSYPVWNNLAAVDEEAKLIALDLSKRRPASVPRLVCRGTSGILIATAIKRYFQCDILFIRKEKENSHHTHYISPDDTTDLIIVDDFVSTGGTMQAIQKELAKHEAHLRVKEVFVKCSHDEGIISRTEWRSLFPKSRKNNNMKEIDAILKWLENNNKSQNYVKIDQALNTLSILLVTLGNDVSKAYEAMNILEDEYDSEEIALQAKFIAEDVGVAAAKIRATSQLTEKRKDYTRAKNLYKKLSVYLERVDNVARAFTQYVSSLKDERKTSPKQV